MPRIGRQLGERLSAAGITTLQELQQAGARHIESITQRNYPFGGPALPGYRVCASSMVVLSLSGLVRQDLACHIESISQRATPLVCPPCLAHAREQGLA